MLEKWTPTPLKPNVYLQKYDMLEKIIYEKMYL